MIKYEEQNLSGVWLITPDRFKDHRGYFSELFRLEEFHNITKTKEFIQDNESMSYKGVFRGLHLQLEYPQAKLIRVVVGSILDVIMDLREGSATFGKTLCIKLTAEKGEQLYVPRGFAHGFYVISEEALVQYKVDNIYSPRTECTLSPIAKDIAIPWKDLGIDPQTIIFSEKDKMGISIEDFRKKIQENENLFVRI